MKKGKVIIIGGNKRSGKTTLTMKLHDKYNFNLINTSRKDNREKVLNDLMKEIVGD